MWPNWSRLVAADLCAAACDFSRCQLIVDVGGKRHGDLLTSIFLQVHSEARAGALARPAFMRSARESGRTNRDTWPWRALPRRFRKATSSSQSRRAATPISLKTILHDWADKDCISLLQNCRKAIKPDGSLIVVERIMPDRVQPCGLHRSVAGMDLTMMLGFGGHERTQSEYLGAA